MCSEPVMRTPASGLEAAYFRRIDIRPGISYSAMLISLRPHSASERSATLNSAVVWLIVAVPMFVCLRLPSYQEILIHRCYIYFRYGVNPEIPAAGGRPQPTARPAPPRTGRTVRGRTPGGPVQGPEPDFHSPRPTQAGRPGGRSPYGEERLLSPHRVPRIDGAFPPGRGGNSRSEEHTSELQ